MGSRYDEKDIQLDGSLIQGGAHDRWEEDNGQGKSVGSDAGDDFSGVFYLSNWLHDSLNIRSSKRGLRFDRSQRECRRVLGLGLGITGLFLVSRLKLSSLQYTILVVDALALIRS